MRGCVGRDNHLTYTCVRRFRPDPTLVKDAPPSQPASLRAVSAQHPNPMGHELPAASTLPYSREPSAALRWVKAIDTLKELTSAQHKFPDVEPTPQPAWIRSVLSHHTQPRKLMGGTTAGQQPLCGRHPPLPYQARRPAYHRVA